MTAPIRDPETTAPLDRAGTPSPTEPGPTLGPDGRAPAPMPDRLGDYVITGLIGEGGMGTVYAAHDEKLNRPAASRRSRPAGRDGDRRV
jgi:serine/threonine protein kinase